MPFVTVPTDDSNLDPLDDDHNEVGLIAPLAFSLPNDWNAAVMLEIDRVRNADDDGYALVWVQSATASLSISGDFSGFVELVNSYNSDDSSAAGDDDEAYFDAGITYALADNMQLDVGTNLGLNSDSEDMRFFVGFSLKK